MEQFSNRAILKFSILGSPPYAIFQDPKNREIWHAMCYIFPDTNKILTNCPQKHTPANSCPTYTMSRSVKCKEYHSLHRYSLNLKILVNVDTSQSKISSLLYSFSRSPGDALLSSPLPHPQRVLKCRCCQKTFQPNCAKLANLIHIGCNFYQIRLQYMNVFLDLINLCSYSLHSLLLGILPDWLAKPPNTLVHASAWLLGISQKKPQNGFVWLGHLIKRSTQRISMFSKLREGWR